MNAKHINEVIAQKPCTYIDNCGITNQTGKEQTLEAVLLGQLVTDTWENCESEPTSYLTQNLPPGRLYT